MRVHSIFQSIDGEVNAYHQGALTTFVRLAGCNLACSYCDTLFAMSFSDGYDATPIIISEVVKNLGLRKVTVTGGEPLFGRGDAIFELLRLLINNGHQVTVETNGSVSLAPFKFLNGSKIPDPVLSEVKWVVDFKLDNSDMRKHMDSDAFMYLGEGDFIKFVVGDRADFVEALAVIRDFKKRFIDLRVKWAFSPIHNVLPPAQLIEWMLQECIPNTVLNVQLHKILGLNEPA